MYICKLLYYITVPKPNVSVNIQNVTMIVGQPLTLECNASAVRGINSQVDIVWSNDNSSKELTRSKNVSALMTNFSTVLLYKDYFNISKLTTDHDGITYECEVIINADPPVRATDNIAIHVTGKHLSYFNHKCNLYSVQFQCSEFLAHQLNYSKKLIWLVVLTLSSVQ